MDFGQDKIVPVDLAGQMRDSYIDYAMSVIVARALPDVRDGLKPVHRRILYAMQEAGMTSAKPYKKSARIVGEVMGKYHPHGDSSIYDAIVRMAQDFSIRYLLADGHGNFGSVDGDPAAAMRYTEVRMSKMSELMLADIEKETVDFAPNYDESLKEPTVLPAKFPQLLVNGSAGIAVGMATNIPPHNLREVIDGVLMLIDEPESTVEELMTVIKGPDFPTGGLIMGREGIVDAYRTGRGLVKMRAKAHIETLSNGKPRIVVTELPYQVNKARLVERIAELVRSKLIDGITDLRDESDRNGMSVVVELRRDANPQVVLNQLYKHTQMQESFGTIMLALVDGQPRVLTLKEMLHYYIKHQEEVITRRTRFNLQKAEARAHILAGLMTALDNLDAVIKTIRESRTAEIAREALMTSFSLSQIQAQAILDMRLQRLTGLEREKIETEQAEVLKNIEWLKSVLADENKIFAIIKDELKEVREKFGDERRTEITLDSTEMNVEDLIADEDIVITLTHNHYIKRIALDTYRNQKRGGRGVTGMGTKETDFVEEILVTTTHRTVMFFTSHGLVYRLKGYDIGEATRQSKGTAIANLLPISGDEKITAVIPVKDFKEDGYLLMSTRHGVVKRTPLSEFDTIRKGGLIAINLDEGDELIGVKLTRGESRVVLATKEGHAALFEETQVRSMGRQARGVRGITLKDEDVVIAMDAFVGDAELLTLTECGYGKRTTADAYRVTKRGSKGVINMKLSEKTGSVIGVKVVQSGQELIAVTEGGVVIRTDIDGIRQTGRSAQGVIIIKTDEGDKAASVAVIDKKEE